MCLAGPVVHQLNGFKMAMWRIPVRKKSLLAAAILLLVIMSFGFHFTGELLHVLVGLASLALSAVHIGIGKRWFATLCVGKYTFKRSCTVSINLLLLTAFIIACGSGVLLFLGLFDAGILLRQIHTSTAYWMLILVGLHIGLYWGAFTRGIQKWPICLSYIWPLILCYGVWASFDRDIGEKLLFRSTFDFFDQGWPSILSVLQYASIMSVYIAIPLIVRKLSRKCNRSHVSLSESGKQ